MLQVVRKARRNSIQDFGYGLTKLLDQAQLNKRKGLKNVQNLLQFKVLMARLSRSDLDTFNAGGMTLLQKASTYGLEDFANLLLDNCVNPNQIVEECGSTPLLLAAYYGHCGVMELFINHKVSQKDMKRSYYNGA